MQFFIGEIIKKYYNEENKCILILIVTYKITYNVLLTER